MSLTRFHDHLRQHLDGMADDDRRLGRFLRTYGEAMLFAQSVEVGAVGALALARSIEQADPAAIDAVVAEYHAKPLGSTLVALRKSNLSDRPFVVELEEIKRRRNVLAHEYLVLRFGHLADPSTYAALQEEIEHERDYFVAAIGRFENWLGPPMLELLADEEMQAVIAAALTPAFDPYDRNE